MPWRWAALLAVLVLCTGCWMAPPLPRRLRPRRLRPRRQMRRSSPQTPRSSMIRSPTSSSSKSAKRNVDGITQDMLDYAEAFPIVPLYDGDGRV